MVYDNFMEFHSLYCVGGECERGKTKSYFFIRIPFRRKCVYVDTTISLPPPAPHVYTYTFVCENKTLIMRRKNEYARGVALVCVARNFTQDSPYIYTREREEKLI